MKNGVEYSKSKNFRIVKNIVSYQVERAEHRVSNTHWFRSGNGPWDWLAHARLEMKALEEGVPESQIGAYLFRKEGVRCPQ